MSTAPITVQLAGEMTIYRASELKDTLLAPLAAAAPQIEVDLAEVEEIDTVGVQLLMLAQREARATGGDLRVVAHSAAVAGVFELLDIKAQFGVAA